jgi:tetratricopeptide (TPR) repeat protein
MSTIETIKELHNQGEYQQAIEGYQAIIAADSNNDEAHFGLAHASSQTQQLEQALDHAKKAVDLNPNSDRYLQFKGQMLLANQQVDEALKAFKRSIKENPNLFYSYLAIGDIYAMKNESSKAKENYKLALKVHQDGIPAIVKLSRLLLIEGEYEAAEDLLQQAELQYPSDPNLKLQMGIMRLEQEEQGFAELYFKKLLEDEPNNHVAKAYLGISLQHSDPQQANQVITELLNQQIKIPELMVAVGISYGNNGDFPEAIRYLNPICQSGLAYPSWLMALAKAYAGNLQPNSAMGVLNEVLKRGNNSKALLMLGQIHQVNNNYAAAIRTFSKVSKDSKNYHQSLLMQAECHYASADYEAVIKQLESVLSDRPDHNSAVKLKLNALSQLGQYDQALALIDSIDSNKQIKEFNQLMHLYAGLLLDEKKQYDQAWDHFSAVEPTKPFEISMISSEDEKIVQRFPAGSADSIFKFVFTDPATGHHEFISWCVENGITPLIDRYTNQARKDVFSEQWTVKMLDDLSEAQIHFLRKKYTKHLNQVITADTQKVTDFMPLSPINLAIIKRIFPQAQVLVLSRNFADLRLHNRVFGSYQVHYQQFSKVCNQLIAMNPNVALVDIDAWQNKDAMALKNIEKVFGAGLTPFAIASVKPLDRLMFPFMHWKNYQQQLND